MSKYIFLGAYFVLNKESRTLRTISCHVDGMPVFHNKTELIEYVNKKKVRIYNNLL